MLKINNFVDTIWGNYIKAIDEATFQTMWEGLIEDAPNWLDKFEISAIENLREGDETYPVVFKLAVPSYILGEMKEENVTWETYEAYVNAQQALEDAISNFFAQHPDKTCTVDEWDHFSDIYKDAYGIRPGSEDWTLR